jgi:hypothetical protein
MEWGSVLTRTPEFGSGGARHHPIQDRLSKLFLTRLASGTVAGQGYKPATWYHPAGRYRKRAIAPVSRIRSSPYFAAPSGANFGFDKDTSKFMILVSFMVQKFARRTRGQDGANF